MDVSIIGKPSRVTVGLCKRAVNLYGDYLLGKRLSKHVSVILEFDSDLNDGNVYALCESVSAGYPAREFEITLSRVLNKRKMLLAIAHEMVHVKQYAKGELRDMVRVNKYRWRGEIYDPDEDYWLLPWERECIGYEYGLYQLFLKHEKAYKKARRAGRV